MNSGYEGGYYNGLGQDSYSVPNSASYYVQDGGYDTSVHEPQMWAHDIPESVQDFHPAACNDHNYLYGQPGAAEPSLYSPSEAFAFGANYDAEAPSFGGGLSPSPPLADPRAGSGRQRKVKMYELPEQDDPALEKRRQLAIKQKKKRDKDEREERQVKIGLEKTEEEIRNLRIELAMRGSNVSMMKNTLAAYGANASYGYPEEVWMAGASEPF